MPAITWMTLAIFIAFTAMPATAAWPIHDFKVIFGTHSDSDADLSEDLQVWLDQAAAAFDDREASDAAMARLIEGYLSEIAQRYDAEGFLPPIMQVVEDEGVRKYAVYVYPFRDETIQNRLEGVVEFDASARVKNFRGTCQGPERWMEVDHNYFTLAAASNEEDLYRALAHELFHGIQGTYDENRFRSLRLCEVINSSVGTAGVFIEGMADGVAEYLAALKYSDRHSSSTERKPLGGYPYYYGLFDPPGKSASYYSSSFWRLLAEEAGGLSFFEYLLRQPLAGNEREDRIDWLEKALKAQGSTKESLYTLLPRAITEIASYVPARYRSYDENTWVKDLFSGPCKKGVKPDGGDVTKIELPDLPPLSAACVDIEWPASSSEKVELRIEAIANSSAVIDQLHLGMARLVSGGNVEYCWSWRASGGGMMGIDSCLNEKVLVQSGPSEGKFAKKWELDSESWNKGGFARLIIVNVAAPPTAKFPNAPGPHNTVDANGVTLRYGIAKTESSGSSDRQFAPAGTVTPMNVPLTGELRRWRVGVQPGMELASVLHPMAMQVVSGIPRIDELRYGLRPGAPMDLAGMAGGAGFEIRSVSESAENVFAIIPSEKIGPNSDPQIRGVVWLQRGPDAAATMINSMLCGSDGDPGVIGSVTRANEDELVLNINTKLCEWDPDFPTRRTFPEVDKLEAVITLPFGWRYFAGSAPRDIMIPGTEVYRQRNEGRTSWMLDDDDTNPEGGPDGLGGSGGGGGGAGGTIEGAGCRCSCEEYEELRSMRGSREPEEQAKQIEMAFCALTCLQQYAACRTAR